MNAMFGIDPEQQDAPQAGAPRRFRSSYLKLIRGWGFDSNGHEGAVMKGWVESRFGLFPTYHKEPMQRISSPVWTTYVEEKMSSRFHNNAILTQLDLLYEFCQWGLATMAAPGQTHIVLYRGVNAFEDHLVFERRGGAQVRASPQQSRLVHLRPRCRRMFRRHDPHHSRADRQRWFSSTSCCPSHPLKGEGEYLVIGGDYRVAGELFMTRARRCDCEGASARGLSRLCDRATRSARRSNS